MLLIVPHIITICTCGLQPTNVVSTSCNMCSLNLTDWICMHLPLSSLGSVHSYQSNYLCPCYELELVLYSKVSNQHILLILFNNVLFLQCIDINHIKKIRLVACRQYANHKYEMYIISNNVILANNQASR